MKVSPTKRKRPRTAPRGKKNGRAAIAKARRVIPPGIYIEIPGGNWQTGRGMAHAHIRNKRGYVYLAWREGDRVKNFYLGKAPRKSPTGDLRSQGPGAGGRRAAARTRSARL